MDMAEDKRRESIFHLHIVWGPVWAAVEDLMVVISKSDATTQAWHTHYNAGKVEDPSIFSRLQASNG